MNKIKGIFFFTALIVSINLIKGQQIQQPNIIPSSPNAQTLLKFGDFPVSLYTGVPNINIPIYTIKLKDISIPISIMYNASGIKVEEEASRIGLGWVLNAGGAITHTIVGRYNDFYSTAYFNSSLSNEMVDLTGIYRFSKYTIDGFPAQFPFTLPAETTQTEMFKSLSNECLECGGVEFSPDVFNYNFGNYSGKFIFSHDGQIIKEKEDNVIIVPSKILENGTDKLQSWLLITPDGTKYYFAQTEQATSSSIPISRGGIYNSTYYLSKIETINNTIINLSYKKYGTQIATYNRIQNSNLAEDISINYSSYEVVCLNEINYPNGSLKFEYKFDREDIKQDPKLVSISIYEGASKTSIWNFEYGYFTANVPSYEMPTLERLNAVTQSGVNYYDESWNKKRLKLSAVEHVANNETLSYKFSYNENKLPTKLSTSQDHWGYYNGTYNYSLIPYVLHNESLDSTKVKLMKYGLGANRNPSENYNQAFILNEIIYPTGGKICFFYEPNKYKTNLFENDPFKKDYYFTEEKYELLEGNGWNNVPTDYIHKVPFSLSLSDKTQYKTTFNVKVKITLNDSYNNWAAPVKALYFSIKSIGGYTPWSFIYQAPDLPERVNETNRTFERSWYNVESYIGDYELTVYGPLRTHISNVEFIATTVSDPSVYLKNNLVGIGGGLRIKEIKHFDASGELQIDKQYLYNYDGADNELKTSGKLMFYPRYITYIQQGNTFSKVTTSKGLRGEGFSVGYSQVNELNIDKVGNIINKIAYNFINKPDKNLYYSWQEVTSPENARMSAKDENPLGIRPFNYSENGTLIKKTMYEYKNSNFSRIKETIFDYYYLGDGPTIIWGIYKSFKIGYGGCNCNFNWDEYARLNPIVTGIPVGYLYPAIRPYSIKVKQKKEIIFTNNDSTEISTTYDYNANDLIRTKELKSGNKIFETINYIYPSDMQENLIMKALTAANRINDPIETKKIRNNSTHQTIYDYSLFNNTPRLAFVRTNTGNDKNIETRVIYSKYSMYGNPVVVSRDDGVNTVYLWGYANQYPIAEIVNAFYSDVENIVKTLFSVASIDELSVLTTPNETPLIDASLQRALPNAQVTTYTYKPLIGMTSKTDPKGVTTYYEYDSFGRLKSIKDTNGKIIEQYDYHYRP